MRRRENRGVQIDSMGLAMLTSFQDACQPSIGTSERKYTYANRYPLEFLHLP